MPNSVASTNLLVNLADANTITAQSRSNFSTAFIFLPSEKRIAIRRVYALFRIIDDVVDEETDVKKQAELLNAWKRELSNTYQGTTLVPLLKELKVSIDRFQIPLEYFLKLIEGCEMDMSKHRYASFTELYEYCFRVASMVGLVCLKIFEYDSPTAQQSAIDLGIALQLTNIIRDVGIDLQKGRIYLPREDLLRFRVSEQELINREYSAQFYELMNFEYERAQSYFKMANPELLKTSDNRLLPAQIMGRVYQRILKKIHRQHFPVLHRRVRLNILEKFWLLSSTLSRHFTK